MLNANTLFPKDQGTSALILTLDSHDKPIFCDNFIYCLSLVKFMKKKDKLGVIYAQNNIGNFNDTVHETNAAP